MVEFFAKPRGASPIQCESLKSAEDCARDFGINGYHRMADVIVDDEIVTTFYSHADSIEVYRIDH